MRRLQQLAGLAIIGAGFGLLYLLSRDGTLDVVEAVVALCVGTVGGWLVSKRWVLDLLREGGTAIRDAIRPPPAGGA